MKFCDKRDSKLIKTTMGDKCPQCDKQELENNSEMLEKQKKQLSIMMSIFTKRHLICYPCITPKTVQVSKSLKLKH